MKKSYLKVLTFAAIIVTAGVFSACSKKQPKNDGKAGASETARKIVIGTGGAVPPASYRDENNNLVGYETDLAKAIFAKLPQYKAEFAIADAISTLTGLDAGTYQISYNIWGYNKPRGEKYLFSDVTLIIPHAIAIREDNDEIKSVRDLPGHTTQTSPGSFNDNIYRTYNKAHPENQIKVSLVDSESNWPVSLLNKKYDFYYWSKTNIEAAIEKTKVTGLKVIEVPVDENYEFSHSIPGNHFYFSKGQEQLRDDFNRVYRELVADGTVQSLFEKYYPGVSNSLTLDKINEVAELIEKDLSE